MENILQWIQKREQFGNFFTYYIWGFFFSHFRLKEAKQNMQAKFEKLHADNKQKTKEVENNVKGEEDLSVAISFQ